MIVKPFRGSILNRWHPLSRGLVGAYLFNECGGPIVSDSRGCFAPGILTGTSANASWSPSADGPCTNLIGSSPCGSVIVNNLSPILRTGDVSVFFRFSLNATRTTGSTVQTLFHLGDPSSYNDITLRFGPFAGYGLITGQLQYFMSSNGACYYASTTTTSFTGGRWYSVAGTLQGLNLAIYLDGILEGSDTSLEARGTSAYSTTTYIGSTFSAGGDPAVSIQGKISVCYVYNRYLSAGEVFVLNQNPYAMFVPRSKYFDFGKLTFIPWIEEDPFS